MSRRRSFRCVEEQRSTIVGSGREFPSKRPARYFTALTPYLSVHARPVRHTVLAAGSSFTVTLSNGTVTTISCPQVCVAGSQFTISMASTSYVPQATVTTQTLAPGGLCVNGSVPGPAGCTSTSLGYYPYGGYSGSYYPGYLGGYSGGYYPGYLGGYPGRYYPVCLGLSIVRRFC
jgi:hypothetical protein